MKVWVDADACPGAIKEIIARAADRLGVQTVFVANKKLILPPSPYLSFVQVDLGADLADQYICEHADSVDLVVTQDILLASHLIPRGNVVIDPRGDTYSEANIGDRVSVRSIMKDLRDTGNITGGPKQFGEKEKRRFANSLDRELTKFLKQH